MAEIDAGSLYKKLKAAKEIVASSAGVPYDEPSLFPGQSDGKVWVTQEGKRILLTEMEDSHIANAVAMLGRGITSRKKAIDHLNNEVSRRQLVKAEEAKKARRMSSLVESKGRFIRDED